jgi:HPr kinase/phosphorylase
MAATRIHASCVVLGEAGVLIRGPSGSGKSTLARTLLAEAERRGSFARLVSDDRTEVEALNGRLIARAVHPIEGQIEARGAAILTGSFEPAAVVRLVVDCGAEPAARLPHESERNSEIGNVSLPRLVHHGDPGFAQIVLWQLGVRDDTPTTR